MLSVASGLNYFRCWIEYQSVDRTGSIDTARSQIGVCSGVSLVTGICLTNVSLTGNSQIGSEQTLTSKDGCTILISLSCTSTCSLDIDVVALWNDPVVNDSALVICELYPKMTIRMLPLQWQFAANSSEVSWSVLTDTKGSGTVAVVFSVLWWPLPTLDERHSFRRVETLYISAILSVITSSHLTVNVMD